MGISPSAPGLQAGSYLLFALTLAGVMLLHRRALVVAVGGACALLAFRIAQGLGGAELVHHVTGEWVTLANLFLLLLGFEVLANQFERSNLPDHLPNLLPDDWTGGVALLGLVLVLSAFLDNIAAAMLGGVIAGKVYRGRVSVGFLAAIVAAANAGGAGSVIGDTTTTLMWLHGISPLAVAPAYFGSLAAFAVFAVAGARAQHRFQPIQGHDEPGHPLGWRRVAVVAFILASAVAANVAATGAGRAGDAAPWLGLAVWAAILATSRIAPPDWSVLRPAGRGAVFLLALVFAASLLPLDGLPAPSATSTFGLGVLSAVFDNIPLTALALGQGGYDWAVLAYAVGFGGSMLWFGSSAGVALTNLYPEGRSALRWLRQGWFVPAGYVAGFAVLTATRTLVR
jgi:Na+/H+ antiporter NhaD/arsenite permease-like protein